MNSSTKVRSLNGFPRVRKRNSVGNKASSRAAQNAVQRCTSLLRNNKSLAGTLQETRCELSTYKNFFEDSLEYMSKVKLARSKMTQLSTSLKNFIKAFDETLLLMDIDDSKWPNIKAPKSSRNIPKGMNTVLEATDEAEEAVSADQEMGCHEGNNLKDAHEPFQNFSTPSVALQNSVSDEESNAIVPKVPSKSPLKKTEESSLKFSTSQTECAKGKDDTKKEIHHFSHKIYPESSSLHSSTSSQAVKKTKIPRCQGLAANLKKQNFPKESELQNCKRNSPEKMCEKSSFESCKRKTFVIKSNNILTSSESTKNQTNLEEISNASEDEIVSIKDKRKTYSKKITDVLDERDELKSMPKDLFVNEKDRRKTFVKKATDISKESEETISSLFALEKDKRKTHVIKRSTIFKETEPFTSSNEMEDKKVAENRVTLSESSDVDNVFISKNNRKTFKKNSDKIVSPLNNVLECPYSSPVKACTPIKSDYTSLIAEQNKNIDAESLDVPSELECNVKTDILAVKTNCITAETIEPILRVTELNEDKEIFLNEVAKDDNISLAVHSNVDDKREEMSENLNSKTDSISSDPIVIDISMHDIDELNRGIVVSDTSQKDEACNHSPIRTRRSFLETSQSDDEILFIEEIDFVEKRPAFQTTPIRGQILKNKKRKFNFDANKRKSILKKSLSKESNASINKNDVTKDKSVHFTSDDLVNKGIAANVQSDTCQTTVKKTKKTSSKKIKENQEASAKNNTAKASNKLHKVKDNTKNCSKDAGVDVLMRKVKKSKKKNVKKIKKEGAYFDDDRISKFKQRKKVIPQVDEETVDKTEEDLETDFPCKKTGENTFLVQAEIHPPPPFTKASEIEKMDNEIAELKLKNMKVAVVLDDVLKSKDIKLLNGYDRDFLCGKSAPVSFSESASDAFVDPDESIERFRCDPVPETDDMCLDSDALLNTDDCDFQSEQEIDSDNTRARRRKAVSYKEPPLNRKMRRC